MCIYLCVYMCVCAHTHTYSLLISQNQNQIFKKITQVEKDVHFLGPKAESPG